MRTCYIVGAGDFTPRDLAPEKEDLLIAADGGYLSLIQNGLRPQLLLGDFDSMPDPGNQADLEMLRYPVEKDDTDTGLALKEGWRRGYRRFALYGCGGGRVDHLLANFQTMGRYASMGAQIRLIDPEYDAYALYNQAMRLPPRPAGTLVSVLCHGDCARGVTLEGLHYPLHQATLTCQFPLGVSNHYTNQEAWVKVENGALLVLVYLEKQ